jgi:hypothetical protein
VLPFGNLVMGSLDLKAHGLQGLNDLAAAIDAGIIGLDVEIPGDIVGDGGGHPLLIAPEEEKFTLGADVHGVAHGLGIGHHPLEVVAGAADKGGAVGLVDIADDAGRIIAVLSRQGSKTKVS